MRSAGRSTRRSAPSSRAPRGANSKSEKSRRSVSAARRPARTRTGRRTGRGPASSTSTPTTCPRARPGAWRRFTSTKARRATISRSCWPPKTRRYPTSCGSAATPPMSRAGRSTPRPCGTSSVWRPTPISGSAASMTRCCARCGWSSTPASTPRVGPASKRSATCSTTAACRRQTSVPKSNAISPSPAKRSPTSWAS